MIHEEIIIHTKHSEAKLYTYLLENSPEMDKNRKRPTVIICPGGGYEITSDREAEPVAIRMNAMGFHALILRYSVRPAVFPTALEELSLTVDLVRHNAEKWYVNQDKIFIAGFSAGGHLAASLGVFWHEDFLSKNLGVPNENIKPNGLILSYPVITSGNHAHKGSFRALLADKYDTDIDKVSLENKVNAHTPPTFLWHTYADDAVPVENSLLFANAMRKNSIPFELHIYPEGGHGLSLANEETANVQQFGIQEASQNWIDMAGVWIKNL